MIFILLTIFFFVLFLSRWTFVLRVSLWVYRIRSDHFSFTMDFVEVIDRAKKSTEHEYLDDFLIDRFHHRYTVAALICFAICLGTYEYLGKMKLFDNDNREKDFYRCILNNFRRSHQMLGSSSVYRNIWRICKSFVFSAKHLQSQWTRICPEDENWAWRKNVEILSMGSFPHCISSSRF